MFLSWFMLCDTATVVEIETISWSLMPGITSRDEMVDGLLIGKENI